tara:strand:+ start:346 stop:549 length:204 start_codon:yes stop_codon:yes gene_type:complete
MKKNDNVLVKGYNPPLKGRVADRYIIPIRNIQDPRLIKIHPNGVPMVEVILENGKLQVFVEDLLEVV